MAKVKQKLKKFGRYVWEMIKAALPSTFMYFCAGTIMMMLAFKKSPVAWTTSTKVWFVVAILAAVAYNGLICWAHGAQHYEMLVSGNIKRATADMYGSAYRISTHKEAKEYRVWKGFAIGGVTALFTLGVGLYFGIRQGRIDQQLTIGSLVGFLLSGWSVLPFYCINKAAGMSISYFITCAFAIIPIVVSGGIYIAGAYARRAKTIRQQILADRAAEAEANKPKKINYGGLPGTKPKKRK